MPSFQTKIEAVLNDDQRAALGQLGHRLGNQVAIQFFRFQPWADVLNWLAEESDLSLVLDAPPPGTFNYSDNREYKPVEAIDLLNGVLATKDFTLIRRGRMLMVLDLKNEIPEGLIPRIALDDLDNRGRMELVSILFPLGGRPADDVNNEITPIIGRHGKSVILPKTGQILVTDYAGNMRAIDALIQSIPSSETAAQEKRSPAAREAGSTHLRQQTPRSKCGDRDVEKTGPLGAIRG